MHLVLGGVFPDKFDHLIIDSGVNRFFKSMGLKDYPQGYIDRYLAMARYLHRRYSDKVWVVIPDYPDDYENNRIENNFEKTLENIVLFIDKEKDVEWIPVIQARWGSKEDFRRAVRELRRVIGSYPRVAVGTLCTRARKDYAVFCCRLARSYFPNSWIHVFGPSLRFLSDISLYIDSIDTTAYYKAPWSIRNTGVKGNRHVYAYTWVKKAGSRIRGVGRLF